MQNPKFQPAVAALLEQLREQEKASTDTKRAINSIYIAAKEPPPFSEADMNGEEPSGPSLSIGSDRFYGQPLATSIRDILEMRRAVKEGPATINDIYDTLNQGGFKFETKNEENAKRGLRISLTKNTALFHKLPNGRFGLLEWYPNVKVSKSARDTGGAADADDADPEKGEGQGA